MADEWLDDLQLACDAKTKYVAMPIQSAKAALAEIERLKAAIREHRDQRGDDRCWQDDAKLYSALGTEGARAETGLPPKAEFLESCSRYWERRQSPYDDRPNCMTIAQLEAEVERLKEVRGAAFVKQLGLAAELAARAEPPRPAAIVRTSLGDGHGFEGVADAKAFYESPSGDRRSFVAFRSWTWHPKSTDGGE